MNKIRQMFRAISPKSVTYLALTFFIVLGLWFWLRTKAEETVKDHHFFIAIDNRWFPLDLHGQEQYMLGFASELTALIGSQEEIKSQIVNVATSQLFDSLEKGYYDGVFSSLSPNVLNEKKFHFSDPIYFVGPVLIVPINSNANSIHGLHNVGVKRGFSGIFAIAGEPLTSVVTYDDMNAALSDLVFGKIDGLVMGGVDAYAYVKGYYADKLKVVTPPLTNEGIRLITLNHFLGKSLIKHFNQGLNELKADGVYEKLLEKWDLVDPEKAYQKS